MNPISNRLLSQQLACPQSATPAEVVSYMGAIQAQDFRAGRWAAVMRTRRPSFKQFEEDFNTGRIVRLHLLRCTWQMLSGDDHGWMLQLCADKAKAALRGWMTSNKIQINADEEDSVSAIIADALTGKRSLSIDEIRTELKGKGIQMDTHRFSYHLRLAELNGLICSGNMNPLQNTYCLVSEKIGPLISALTREEALVRLAERYFISRSPATFDDFVWWSGLNAGECRKAVDMLGDSLHTEHWHGRDFLVHEKSRSRGFRSGSVLLLPPYDEYLISYKSRDIVLEPALAHKAHNNFGIFKPVIAVDGKIVGNWNPTSKDGKVEIFKGKVNADSIARRLEEFHMAQVR